MSFNASNIVNTPVQINKKTSGLTIGEVSKKLDVNISTLRYWGKEFSEFLQTQRTSGKQRRFSDENIKVLKEIKYMIDVEKYTLEGAKRRMSINRDKMPIFKNLINEALTQIEEGESKQVVIENLVQRNVLGI